MKRRFINILMIAAALAFAGACTDNSEMDEVNSLKITSSVNSFDGEVQTRVNLPGDSFVAGDLIRLKITCPFTSVSQNAESTSSNTSDAFWLLMWDGGNWSTVTAAQKFIINGGYRYTAAPDLFAEYEAQATPYVYTAMTWSEEKVLRSGEYVIDQYSNVFHANQSKEKDYLASDLLWAQEFSQTGTWNIHLAFNHVMSAIYVRAEDLYLSESAVLTLEGMPDIDQAEVVVGDYYADASKAKAPYGYSEKASCAPENNGKVIGVAVMDETAGRAKTWSMTGNPSPAGGDYNSTVWGTVPNTGVYTAYNCGGRIYRLIVPPCTLEENPVFWFRDGSRRYSCELNQKTFEQGKLYEVSITAPAN